MQEGCRKEMDLQLEGGQHRAGNWLQRGWGVGTGTGAVLQGQHRWQEGNEEGSRSSRPQGCRFLHLAGGPIPSQHHQNRPAGSVLPSALALVHGEGDNEQL